MKLIYVLGIAAIISIYAVVKCDNGFGMDMPLPFSGHSLNQTNVTTLKPQSKVLAKIKAGVDAGRAIVDALAKGDDTSHFSNIVSIAKHVGPFLGVIGPLVALIDIFTPKGPSKELQYMTQQFAQINKRFDQVAYRFDDLEKVILKHSLKQQYALHEEHIHTLSKLLSNIIDAKSKNKSKEIIEARKNIFFAEYDKVPILTTLNFFYEGMTEQPQFPLSIPDTVRNYTDDNRLETQTELKAVLNIILKGIKVVLAYNQLKGKNTSYEIQQREWTEKIQNLTAHMVAVDDEIVQITPVQMKKDVDRFVKENSQLSNKAFADKLYAFLKQKYDYRDWFVIVYSNIEDLKFKMHVKTRADSVAWHVDGRNIIITSNPKDVPGGKSLNKGFFGKKFPMDKTWTDMASS